MQREIKFPNRSVLLWARAREKRLRKLRNRLLRPASVSRNCFKREKEVEEELLKNMMVIPNIIDRERRQRERRN